MLDYGIIGNCKSCALVKKDSSIDWMCYPTLSSPSVFAKILDEEKGGNFKIIPNEKCEIKQEYIKNTNILETYFKAKEFEFKIIDFFPRYNKILANKKQKIIKENRLVRIIEPIKGIPKLKVVFEPKLNYALSKTKLIESEKSIDISDDKTKLKLMTNIYLNKVLKKEEFELRKRIYFIFGEPTDPKEYDLRKCSQLLLHTKRYWENWSNNLILPEFNKEIITRSALCLKLLTYSESGAIIAAATTSIPEEIKSKRTWDYRFCWVRDSTMTADALNKIGRSHEAKKLIEFIMNRVIKDDHLQIMYGINGETKLEEKKLNHLSGFLGSKPVRIGNAAFNQNQNDIYGEIIDLLYLYYVYYELEKKMTKKHLNFLKFLVNQIKFNWYKKDQGIWEFRGLKKHYTFSKMMCYIGVDRAIKIAQHFKHDEFANDWIILLEEIREEIFKKGYNKNVESFTLFYGSKSLDASLLLMAYHEFLNKSDQRLINTIKNIYNELRNGDLVKRYDIKDDFGKTKSSFTICSFWLVEALIYIGEKSKAKRLFESLLKKSNHLGLFSEDIDIKTKKLIGNFPQAYTHIAIINCSILLSEWSTKRKKIDWSSIKRKWI
jgi:alpha,alpha-trehalase